MAIWEALVDGDKRRLNDDGTLFLLQVFGVGLPPARRLKTRSPQQHGSTDLGFRYDEREMRLGFFFNALNETAAVAKRDELYAFWRSLSDIPIQLRYTRDDNSVRQIDCHVVGVMDMPWNPDENQNGLQNFVVQVEAANPLWYDPTAEVVSFSQEDMPEVPTWWLGFGTISESAVEEYVEMPAANTEFVINTIDDGDPWTIFTRATPPVSGLDEMWHTRSATALQVIPVYESGVRNDINTTPGIFATGFFLPAESNYFVVCDGATLYAYRENTLIGSRAFAGGIDLDSSSAWRSSSSDFTIARGVIYNTALDSTQREALIASSSESAIDISQTTTYTGSFLTYPIITVTGPITDPILTNVSTGEDLDFTGITIAGGDTYTIDCRFGYKTVKNAAGTNKIADLTAASDLATFHLGADPDVSGGANAFTLTGTGTDANTTVTVTYNERFVGA